MTELILRMKFSIQNCRDGVLILDYNNCRQIIANTDTQLIIIIITLFTLQYLQELR